MVNYFNLSSNIYIYKGRSKILLFKPKKKTYCGEIIGEEKKANYIVIEKVPFNNKFLSCVKPLSKYIKDERQHLRVFQKWGQTTKCVI